MAWPCVSGLSLVSRSASSHNSDALFFLSYFLLSLRAHPSLTRRLFLPDLAASNTVTRPSLPPLAQDRSTHRLLFCVDVGPRLDPLLAEYRVTDALLARPPRGARLCVLLLSRGPVSFPQHLALLLSDQHPICWEQTGSERPIVWPKVTEPERGPAGLGAPR